MHISDVESDKKQLGSAGRTKNLYVTGLDENESFWRGQDEKESFFIGSVSVNHQLLSLGKAQIGMWWL